YIIFEFIVLQFQIFYYILESIFRLFVPVEPESVKGEIVLITGTGHGIGQQLAYQYAAAGAKVVCWDINEKNNQATAEEIVKRGYARPHCYVCDVSNRQEVLKVGEEVKKEVGNVNILINNAGIMPTHPLEQHTEEEIRRIMDINVLAHFWTLEAFLPAMKQANRGHIVCLSSIAGVVGIPNLVPYSASKFAVRGLMETLAEELRWNPTNQIKTTTVCPFMVDTGLCKRPFVKFEQALNLLSPEHVAQKIAQAQRTGKTEITIPEILLPVGILTRLLPEKAQIKVKEFFNSGVNSDLE
ncbi:short-chain dehydrogenase/reductase family 16C member 6, partial [Cylas formicarius]|uniref:short-chain dehydrogenase/reductase family 16C member 6 n=1 Tax=Cylas formicarius TaxID=197179 RepID=UPI0029587B27